MFLVPVFLFVVVYGSPRFLEMRTVMKQKVMCREIQPGEDEVQWEGDTAYNNTSDRAVMQEDGDDVWSEMRQVNGTLYACLMERIPTIQFNDIRKGQLYKAVRRAPIWRLATHCAHARMNKAFTYLPTYSTTTTIISWQPFSTRVPVP